jgi:hypothetical protein
VGVTEVDEQGSAENHEGDADEGRPLEVSEVSDGTVKVSLLLIVRSVGRLTVRRMGR